LFIIVIAVFGTILLQSGAIDEKAFMEERHGIDYQTHKYYMRWDKLYDYLIDMPVQGYARLLEVQARLIAYKESVIGNFRKEMAGDK